jgi:hypothetical protein
MALKRSSQGGSWRRNGGAAAASLAGHLLAVLLLLGGAAGDLVPSGASIGNGASGADEPSMTVTLVDPADQPSSDASSSDAAKATAASVSQLLARLAVTAPSVAVTPASRPERTSLDEILGEDRSDGTGKGKGQARAEQTSGGRGASPPQAGPSHSGATASSGGLFGQIEPCWRRQPGVSRARVKLELILSGDGRLAAPPKIIRTADMVLDERQFSAEARALNALKECLPLRRGAATGVQEVEFRPEG